MSIYECLNLSILSLHIGKILIICTTIPNLIFYIYILKKVLILSHAELVASLINDVATSVITFSQSTCGR